MLRRCQTEAEHSLLPDLGCLMLKCGKLGMSEMGLSDLEGLILIFFSYRPQTNVPRHLHQSTWKITLIKATKNALWSKGASEIIT